jgi:hypothetical protein
MNLTFLTIFESLYLFYMYFIFKTNYSFNNAMFDKQFNSMGSYFVHDTGRFENKICLFGKFMAIFAIILAFIRLSSNNKPSLFYITLIFDIVCLLLASFMNLNALVYIIPIILCEIYIIYNYLKN